MNRKVSFIIGGLFILMGSAWLFFSLMGLAFGFRIWQLWPLLVIATGIGCILPPMLTKGHRALGALFIPGLPLLATGSLLLIASIFRAWNIWSWLWPIEVIAVGVGFLCAARHMRLPGLLIPALIIGMNGLLLQFCALSGWWSIWAVAWTVEPLSIGLGLLALNVFRPARGLLLAGILMLSITLLGFALSVAIALLGFILPLGWVLRLIIPGTLILLGLIVLGTSLFPRLSATGLIAE